ncbi:chemotaxis protein CheB [Roseobacter sp. A03A-229]
MIDGDPMREVKVQDRHQDRERYVVAIGASAGGLTAIRELIAELPKGFAAPIVIGVHSEPSSQLTEILSGYSSLKIKKITDGDLLEPGWIYVVPGARHALFRNGRIQLSEVVQESGFRPSIDAMFMTLAAEYGEHGIAVVLSGMLKDGMRGAQVIHDLGGQTIVQDPADATHAGMPNSVIRHDHPEAVRSAAQLGIWLRDLVGTT